ncbi:Chitin binding domain [Trinorchestia longiramus]|nr:Chitin binding domain [Trinorchestia longiramus]
MKCDWFTAGEQQMQVPESPLQLLQSRCSSVLNEFCPAAPCTVQHRAALCSVVLHCAAPCCTVQRRATLCSVVLHSAASCCTASACLYVSVLLLMTLSSTTAQKNNKNKDVETSTANTADISEDETSTGPPLTGDPQKDYIHDPNLPHELIGYDLSDYPFYKRVPKEGHNFTCDGRHDGFYASVRHKCQVYYNCLFGQRYDFLCANYTVFDQVNFICHYASEVDCASSARYYDRNEELYVTTTTTTPAPPRVIYVDRPRPRPLRPLNIRRPLPPRRRQRPQIRVESSDTAATSADQPEAASKDTQYSDTYDNADYYNDYYDDYYYDDAALLTQTTTTSTTTTARPLRRRPNRPGSGPRRGGAGGRGRGGGGGGGRRRQRPRQRGGAGPGGRRRRIRTSTTTTEAAPVLDDYYDYYDDYYEDEAPAVQNEPIQPVEAPTTVKPKSGPRNKPGQIRRPSFKRAQSDTPAAEPVIIEPTLPPAATETAVEETFIEDIEPFQADISLTQAEAPLEGVRQINRRGRPIIQRIRTRPVNSRDFTVDEAAGAPVEPEAPVESEVPVESEAINSEPQEQSRGSNTGESLRDRRQRLGLSRRGPAVEAAEVAPLEAEEEAPSRQAGRGFGGRRPRP